MAQFANDTFTEASNTALASHTPEDGTSWVQHTVSSETITVIASGDYAQGSSLTSTSWYYISDDPGGAEYDVQADVQWEEVINGGFQGVAGRGSTTDATYYAAWRTTFDSRWDLVVSQAGSVTVLGSYSASDGAEDTYYTLKLEIRNAAKKLYTSGVERLSSSNNDVTATGKAGIRCRQQSRIDNFVATDLTGGGAANANYLPLLGVG